MSVLLSPKWWAMALLNTFLTMVMIYIIKYAANRWNIPVVKTVADNV